MSKIVKNRQKSKNGPKTGGFKGFGKMVILAPYGAEQETAQKPKKHRFFTFFYRVPWDPQNRSKSTKIDKNDQIREKRHFAHKPQYQIQCKTNRDIEIEINK